MESEPAEEFSSKFNSTDSVGNEYERMYYIIHYEEVDSSKHRIRECRNETKLSIMSEYSIERQI
ncbi:hypothetical protein ENUP19_0054G0048 [Entamoeba nuttalli]|uniref:Uncharacterized protein n=1 Tax=Entamoeba nuttalli TaxID=412467 RepID=A0ABQ0DC83_9EUKA